MSQIEKNKLDKGDAFPKLELRLINGNPLIIPDEVSGNWSVLLFYRGHW